MDIGFIGVGRMGHPMVRRLIAAGHRLIVHDASAEAIARAEKLGARAAASPAEVADRAETVMASLPTPAIVLAVATGPKGVIEGKRVRRFVDLSTTGAGMAARICELLKARNIAQIDAPVSGGVGGAEKGTLAVMVSGPAADILAIEPALAVIGKVFRIGERAGRNTASQDKFPRAIVTRTFDYGFSTALMLKDVKLCLDEAKALGVPHDVMEAVGRLWQLTQDEIGGNEDFTTIVQPPERRAGVEVKAG